MNEPWSSQPDGWSEPEDETELGPYGRDEPPSFPIRVPSFGFARATGCPKCQTRNALRRQAGLDPLPQSIRIRYRDLAVWCFRCDTAFIPRTLAELFRAAGFP